MDNSVLHCLQQLQKVVECSICLETMTNPVQTKCNHSFCSHCIHKAMAERPSFKCPLCKTAISKRSLKKSSYLTEVISTLTTLNKSAHKEMHVEGFTEPKSTEKESGVLKKGNNSRNMLKKSATPEQPPGFAEEHSQVEDMNLIPRTEDQMTPDLLDFVETTKSPNGVKLDPKSTKSSKLNLDKSAKKVADNAGGSANTESADTNPDELYDFPQSQPSTRGKVPVKKTRKAITKKSAKKLIWDKSVTANQSRKKQEKGKKAKTSSPPLPVKSPTDIKIIENIKETESHKLVIEKRRTGRSSSIEKSKQTVAVMFVQSPKKITTTETTPDIQPVAVKPNLRAITKKCTKKQPKEVHFQDKDVTPPLAPLAVSTTLDCCDSVPKNEATPTKPHTPGMETSSSIVAKCLKEHEHLTRRLMYAESSSDDNMMMPVSSVTDRNQTGYQDKVASWLKDVDPALEHTETTDGQKQLESIKDSDLEDMVSISQVLNEDSCKIVRRKKRNLPSVPVKTKLTSVIRNAEVFGDKKPKHKYSAKNKSYDFAKNLSESSAQLKESNNFVQALISNEKKTTKRRLRSSKKFNKKNIFDVPGLSQGVSPFTTPTKDGTTDTDSPAYPTVTENQPKNEETETVESNNMKNAHSSDKSEEIMPEKMISDDVSVKISSTDQKSHEVNVPTSNGDGNNGQSSGNEKQNSNDQAGALHSKNIDMSDPTVKDSTPPKNAVTSEKVDSEKFLIKLKHDKTPKSKTITPPKSTPSSLGQRSGRARKGSFSKTPPQNSPEHVLVAAHDTLPKTPPSQLENMPVICVGETEENTQDSKAYYVDTPPTTECSLLESNDCKKSETEKNDKVTKRQPVELGLLDFSGPSQPVKLNSQPNKKIMETCRMVIDNLGSSKSEVLSENETGPLSDNLLVVGRSVNLTKVQSNNSDAEVATNTMKEIHEKLSQIEEPACLIESTHDVCGSPQKQENEISVKLQGSSTYACDTDSSITNSTNCILNSEPTSNKLVSKNDPVVVKIKRANVRNVKTRKVGVLPASRTIKKKGRPSKAVRRTSYKLKMNFASSSKKKTGKTIKTISDRLLEQKKLSQVSTNSQSQISESVKEMEKNVLSSVEKTKDFCNESGADDRNVLENKNKSFPSTSSEEMMCTSNGWGGTKLKIRICRSSDHSPKKSSDAATKKQNVSNEKKVQHFLKDKTIENLPTSPAVIPNSMKLTSNRNKIAKKTGPYSKKTKIPVSTCAATDLISSSCPLPQTDDEFKQNDKIIRSFERSLSVNLIRCDIDTLHFTHPMPKVDRKIQKGRRTGVKVDSKRIGSEDHISSSPLLFPPSQEQTNEVQKSTDQHEKDTSDNKKAIVEEKKEDNWNKIDTNMNIVNENAGTTTNSQEEEETDHFHLPEKIENFLSSLNKTLQLSKEIELSFPALVADFEKWREYCMKISHTLKLGEETHDDSNQNLETFTPNKDQVMSDDRQSQPVIKPTEIDMDDEIDCSLPTVRHILNARERTQELDNSSSKEKNVFVEEPILIGDKEDDLVIIDEDQGLEDGNNTYLLDDDNTPTLPESTGQSSVFPDQIQASPIQASQDMLPCSAGSTGNPVFKRSLLSLKRKRVLSSSSDSCSPKQPKRKRIICNDEEGQSSQEFSNSGKSENCFNEHFASQASEKSIDIVNSSLQSDPAHNLESNEGLMKDEPSKEDENMVDKEEQSMDLNNRLDENIPDTPDSPLTNDTSENEVVKLQPNPVDMATQMDECFEEMHNSTPADILSEIDETPFTLSQIPPPTPPPPINNQPSVSAPGPAQSDTIYVDDLLRKISEFTEDYKTVTNDDTDDTALQLDNFFIEERTKNNQPSVPKESVNLEKHTPIPRESTVSTDTLNTSKKQVTENVKENDNMTPIESPNGSKKPLRQSSFSEPISPLKLPSLPNKSTARKKRNSQIGVSKPDEKNSSLTPRSNPPAAVLTSKPPKPTTPSRTPKAFVQPTSSVKKFQKNQRSTQLSECTNQATPNTPNKDINLSDVSMTIRGSNKKLGIMTSGIQGKGQQVVRVIAKKYDGKFFNKFVNGEVTHLVVKTENTRCDRTLKYLQAIASRCWIVSILWVTQSLKQKRLLPENEFEVIGDKIETDPVLFYGPRRSREAPKEYKLLSDYFICCYCPFALFTAEELMELLKLCGAHVTSSLKDLASDRSNQKKMIVFDPDAYTDSLPNYNEIAARYNSEAVSSNWALECIASFTVQPTAVYPVEEFESQLS